MPSVPHIIQMRQKRRARSRRNPTGSFGMSLSLLFSLLVALGFVSLALAYTSLSQGLPSLQALPALLDPPDGLLLQPTRLYDRSGKHVLLTLQNPAAAGRQFLKLADLEGEAGQPSGEEAPSQQQIFPSDLISATIAAEDPSFWKNWGFSLGGTTQGSQHTLAERLVSDLLLWDEAPGLRRDLQERLLAAQITFHFGREKVLDWYLNSANYGRQAYGADAAARVYFGKPATQLTLAEAAMLAAVADAPALNPLDASQAAIERQQQVIQAMLDQGLISPAQAIQAKQEKPAFRQTAPAEQNTAPAFTSLVLDQLATQIPLERLERGGLRILTTLDYDLQLQTSCASATQLARLERTPIEDSGQGGQDCPAARLLPTLPAGSGPAPTGMGVNAVVLDPHTGQVLALVGTPPAESRSLPGHPPGTLLTPFVYLTAFTRGMSPASLVWDIPAGLKDPTVENFDGQFHGPMRLRLALANDYVVPAMKILDQVGPENVWRTAQQFGLNSLDFASNQADRLLLEGGEMSLLEASRAFGIFSDQGTLAGRVLATNTNPNEPSTLHPLVIQRVEDNTGRVWLSWDASQTRPVITPQLAYLMTNVLSDEAARWPSLGHPNALEIGRPAAAKIGRTANGQNAWTIGYTPQLVVGVWIGQGSSQASGEVSPNVAAALWHALIQYASRSLPSQTWLMPPGISTLEVCDPSGLLPTADCQSTANEVFLDGTEPTQADNMYKALQINRETGHLATVFTPPEFVERRVFMEVPPEALDWARSAGLPIPPESYDVIAAPSPPLPDAQISSPAMFSYVHGKVPITGTAGGEGFSYYRLQVGEGMDPQEWLQIGQDVSKSVRDGELATWDTTGLSGLYAIQLRVVRTDQRGDTATIQVAVDNQAPEVRILYPAEGQELALPASRILVFQVDASDDLMVKSVAFYVDGRLVRTLTQAPFALPWQASSGTHTLRVVAMDMAGNESEATSQFVLKR